MKAAKQQSQVYSSYFTLLMRWLRSLTPVTYFSKLLGFTHLPPSSTAKYFEYWVNTIRLKLRVAVA
ncbi:hypothetical protein C0560_01520 [Lelliottia sp. AC1]|nr:hypothetical protein DAI21_03100 [Lelliottia sp. WB101]PKA29693.1 hypothetical protein CWR41_07120 [Cedecea lapagei]UQC69528.1 hypothetical protein C0560_01520 [Lelliottia sp. AC1]